MTVIRDVTVRVKTEWEKARYEMPGSGGGKGGGHDWGLPDDKAFQRQRRAIDEAAAAEREMVNVSLELKNATQEQTHAVQEFGASSAKAYINAGQGIVQLTRGIALLGAASEEDTKRLLEMIVAVEGLSSAGKGALKVYQSLSTVFSDPAAKAITAITIALIAAAAAWRKFAYAADEAEKSARKARDTMRDAAKEANQFYNAMSRQRDDIGAERVSDALLRESKTSAINKELARQRSVSSIEDNFMAEVRKRHGGQLTPADYQDLAGSEERRYESLKRQKDLLHQLSNLEIDAVGGGIFSELFPPSRQTSAIDDAINDAKIEAIQRRYEKSLSSLSDAMDETAKRINAANAGALND